jgi:hypothetical protein
MAIWPFGNFVWPFDKFTPFLVYCTQKKSGNPDVHM